MKKVYKMVKCPECKKKCDPRGLGTHRYHAHGISKKDKDVPANAAAIMPQKRKYLKRRKSRIGNGIMPASGILANATTVETPRSRLSNLVRALSLFMHMEHDDQLTDKEVMLMIGANGV